MQLFNKDIEPSCAYCRHGTGIGGGEIACIKRGITSISGSCAKFKYEPTKRVPEHTRRFRVSVFSEEDFTL